jgi:hypothetical protein
LEEQGMCAAQVLAEPVNAEPDMTLSCLLLCFIMLLWPDFCTAADTLFAVPIDLQVQL